MDHKIMKAIILRSVFIINTDEYKADKQKISDECRRYCELILESCTDDQIRHTAIDHLCDHYAEIGDTDKALEMANKMPFMCQSKDFLLANIFKGDNETYKKQRLVFDLIQFLSKRIVTNYKSDKGEYLYSDGEVAALRDKLIAFLELMFEKGDYGFYHGDLCDIHREQARRYYAVKKDASQVLYHLEKATEHAIGFIEFMRQDSFVHSSLMFKGMEDGPEGVMLSNSDNLAMITLKHLDLKEYDFIKDMPELQSLKEKLIPYAEKNCY